MKLAMKLREKLLAELEASHQLSYEEPWAKLANIACSEAGYSASWSSFSGQQLSHYLLYWINRVQIIILSIRDGQVFSLSATCLLEVSTS